MESQRIVLDSNEVAWIVEDRRARFPEGECGFACLGRGSRGWEGRSKNGGNGALGGRLGAAGMGQAAGLHGPAQFIFNDF